MAQHHCRVRSRACRDIDHAVYLDAAGGNMDDLHHRWMGFVSRRVGRDGGGDGLRCGLGGRRDEQGQRGGGQQFFIDLLNQCDAFSLLARPRGAA